MMTVISISQSRKDLPKVPFGELVEQGIIPPGAVLTDSKNIYTKQPLKLTEQ